MYGPGSFQYRPRNKGIGWRSEPDRRKSPRARTFRLRATLQGYLFKYPACLQEPSETQVKPILLSSWTYQVGPINGNHVFDWALAPSLKAGVLGKVTEPCPLKAGVSGTLGPASSPKEGGL